MTTTNKTKHSIRASDYDSMREAIATAIGMSAQLGAPLTLHVHDFDYDDARTVLAYWCAAQFCGGQEFSGTDFSSCRRAHIVLAEVQQ